ncbi:MarR family winged helix-turn-helix transcriptional regulator [Lutibacter sp.]|uniref:MarR family winged helix-turn-helix transcriptional regulator n=1 Tax=Lutibacter sp. TaxID=1925666 RepID=UPI002736F2D5|nr:MarR family transcriptional regulator [Lutibacter sp.]MDP3312876.1 MarR family transcriptional regulator [Lutibacter sp.]
MTSNTDFNETLAPWIGKTAKMMSSYISEVLIKHNFKVTKEQWVVLKILHENNNGIIQNDLAFLTERNKASLTRLINCMEKKNLVKRIHSKSDARKNLIFVTSAGKNLFEDSKTLMLNSFKSLQKNISNEEVQQLILTLTKIQDNLNTSK